MCIPADWLNSVRQTSSTERKNYSIQSKYNHKEKFYNIHTHNTIVFMMPWRYSSQTLVIESTNKYKTVCI